jgi:hypothetical protein
MIFFKRCARKSKKLTFFHPSGFFSSRGAKIQGHTKSDEKIANFGFSDFVAHINSSGGYGGWLACNGCGGGGGGGGRDSDSWQ